MKYTTNDILNGCAKGCGSLYAGFAGAAVGGRLGNFLVKTLEEHPKRNKITTLIRDVLIIVGGQIVGFSVASYGTWSLAGLLLANQPRQNQP